MIMNSTNLTAHQQEVFNDIMTDLTEKMKHFYMNDDPLSHLGSLTGSAGTGKSFLTAKIVSDMVNYISNSPYPYDNICVTAPTHKAVGILRDVLNQNTVKVHCSTLQSFLKIKLRRDLNTGAEKFVADKFDPNQNRASLLIIDESSMISPELFDLIVEAVSTRRVQEVLFIGDPYQLLPVSNGENKVYQLKQQHQLTEIVRQKKDNAIIDLSQKLKSRIKEQNFIRLDEIFEEITNSKDIEIFSDKDAFIEDFYKNKDWYKEDKVITSFANATIEPLNELMRTQYWVERGIADPEYLMEGDTIRFKSALNTDGVDSIKTSGVFNNEEEVTLSGTELKIDSKLNIKYWRCSVCDKKSNIFYVLDPNSLISFNKILHNTAIDARNSAFPFNRKHWRKFFGLKNSFANIQYNFASTIHKLQGSTFDTVYIDLNSFIYNTQMDDDDKYRLVYVAITRARNNIKVLY